MSCHVKVLVPSAFLLMASACSHEQKPPVAMSVSPAHAPVPVAKAPPPAHPATPLAPAVVLASKNKEGSSIFFDFDSAQLREEAHPVLQQVASTFWGKKEEKLRVEGNCDELGTVEYNLALGEHRALAAKDYLAHLGVPRDRIATISYGSQRPKYPGADEADRQKNRRDDFVVTR